MLTSLEAHASCFFPPPSLKMMQTVKPISDAARRRAEQADRNGQRCLVENCPKERAVELAYVFDREHFCTHIYGEPFQIGAVHL